MTVDRLAHRSGKSVPERGIVKQDTTWVFFATRARPSFTQRQLAVRLAEEQPVVVVTEALSLLRVRRRASLSDRIRYCPEPSRLREFTPVHYPERIPIAGDWLRRVGHKRLARELDRVLAEFGRARRVVCYDSPSHHTLVGNLGEDLSVYLAIDDRTITLFGEPISGELAAERELLARVDRVICVSASLAETIRGRARSRQDFQIDVLGNGYDERLFDPQRDWVEPAVLADIPRPRILVAGHVSERIDWDGIAAAAALRREWAWVFVGPADAGMEERIAGIVAATGARMFLLPAVPHHVIPAWVAHCEVCAVPYRLNAFTRASSPLKAIEYLGAGAPVLSTRIPSLSAFGGAVVWVEEGGGASYASALDSLANSGRSSEAMELRRSYVRDESWANKARRVHELLES